MNDLTDYEKAVAVYHGTLKAKNTPIYCWDFNNNFLDQVKNFFLDVNALNALAIKNKWNKGSMNFKDSLKEEVIIVTDVKLKIVFASHNIVAMNGYSPAEVLGKSPKMFQGSQTNAMISREIGEAVRHLKPFKKTLLNYKKNGETYICLIQGFPVFNAKGQLSHYIAFEKAA